MAKRTFDLMLQRKEVMMASSSRNRRAAILMLVLVVLAVAGLLGLQAVQSLVLIRSAESQRQKMMQSKEVLEYARKASAVSGRFEKAEVVVGERTAELSVENETGKGSDQARVVVRYPLGAPSELKTSWPIRIRNRSSETEPTAESESVPRLETEANNQSEEPVGSR